MLSGKNTPLINNRGTPLFFNYILNIVSHFIRGVPPSEKDVKVSNKLYVSNIPFTINDDDLKSLFESCGTVVEAKIVTFKDTRKPRGFGFVTMETEEQAQQAINLIDGKEIKGRALNVMVAKDNPNNNSKRAQKLETGICLLCDEEKELYGFENDKGLCSTCISSLSRASRPPYQSRKPRYNYNRSSY